MATNPAVQLRARTSPIVTSSGAAGLARRPAINRDRSTTLPIAPSTAAAGRQTRRGVHGLERVEAQHRRRRDTREVTHGAELRRCRGIAERGQERHVTRAAGRAEPRECSLAPASPRGGREDHRTDCAHQQHQRQNTAPTSPDLAPGQHPHCAHSARPRSAERRSKDRDAHATYSTPTRSSSQGGQNPPAGGGNPLPTRREALPRNRLATAGPFHRTPSSSCPCFFQVRVRRMRDSMS